MAISTVTASAQAGFQWSCGNNLTGAAYNPIANTGNIRKNYSVGTAISNGASGGCDEVFTFQQAITAGSSATIDLTAMTNILQQSGVSIARIKSYMIRLLSAADDPTITPAPTVTSTMLVTNNGPGVPANLDFGNGGSGLTLALTVGSTIVTAVAIGAAGSGYPPSSCFLVAPVQAGGSGCVVAVITNGSGVPTSVVFIAGAGGTGYTAATVPSTPVGAYLLGTGNAHLLVDISATGITIDATHKNVLLKNMDGANAITAEVDFFAATT